MTAASRRTSSLGSIFAVAKSVNGGFSEYMVADPQSVNSGHAIGIPVRSRTGPTYNSHLFSEFARIPTAR